MRLRLWLLVALLGVVGWLMQSLRSPQTVANIGRLLALSAEDLPSEQDSPQSRTVEGAAPLLRPGPAAPGSDLPTPGRSKPDASTPQRAPQDAIWDAVRDNTYFLPQEQDAWLALLAKAQQRARQQQSGGPAPPGESRGEIAYAQLVQQPDVYRGELITLRGTVVRTELTHPAANALGIDQYYRLWVAPEGGGQWPFVVYVLQLPAQFPQGDRLRAKVALEGYFFKNWSYGYEGGLGLAPVLVATTVGWQPEPVAAPPSRLTATDPRWGWAIAAAVVVALGSAAWVARQTRRRRPAARAGEFDPRGLVAPDEANSKETP